LPNRGVIPTLRHSLQMSSAKDGPKSTAMPSPLPRKTTLFATGARQPLTIDSGTSEVPGKSANFGIRLALMTANRLHWLKKIVLLLS